MDARTFCGPGFPWPLIRDLADGDDVTAVYVVLESRRSETKANKPYLKLVLGDSTGTIDGMIWDDVELWEPSCSVEAVVGVRGRISKFQDRLQLRVQSVRCVAASGEEMKLLLPASTRPMIEMECELRKLIQSVDDHSLQALLNRFLGADTALGNAFRSHPAAKRNHHAYLSGLLEHSLSVAGLCDRLAAHYAETGVQLDRDLLVTGALLHDIGKLRELKGFPGVTYTTEGQLLGHIVIGIQMVSHEAQAVPDLPSDRLLHLQHLIASHQGRPEWDSPKVPQMLEALVLHYADDLDAKLNQAAALVAGVEEGEWTPYDRGFSRSFLRSSAPAPALIGSGPVVEQPTSRTRQEPVVRDDEDQGPADSPSESVMDLFK
ncbi:HD domain-containing protein [soil metagenome]